MANVTLIEVDDLNKTKLQPYVAQCIEHGAPDPGFHAVMGHNPDLAEAVYLYHVDTFAEGRFDHRIKEIQRVLFDRWLADCTF
jgi:hypothetical protein